MEIILITSQPQHGPIISIITLVSQWDLRVTIFTLKAESWETKIVLIMQHFDVEILRTYSI